MKKQQLKGLEESFWVIEYKETGKFISKLEQTRVLPMVAETTDELYKAMRFNEADSGALLEYLYSKGYTVRMFLVEAQYKVPTWK